MQNILDRNLICEIFAGEDIDTHINQMKWRLFDAGAKKGDLVTISIMGVNIKHVGAILACAEMGLRVFILDSPATKESLPFTKLALHGPSDYYIYSSAEDTTKIYNGLHDEMMRRYGGVSIDAESPTQHKFFQAAPVYEDDPFLVSSTSGTTGPSKPVTFSHKEVVGIAKRNIKIFGFTRHSRVIHSRNLHHASAMLTSLLPSLMVTSVRQSSEHNHHTFSIGHDNSNDESISYLRGLHGIYELGASHIMIPNKSTLYDFLDSFSGPFRKTLNINMSGFVLDEEFVELAKKYNVAFQSHYGSIDTAIPLLVNYVNANTKILPNSLGVLPDNFYKTTLKYGQMMVEHEWWDNPRYIDDDISFVDGQYILNRQREPQIDVPDGFDITPFFQDTKINYEQLRGHLSVISKRV
jgi:hypothetical protein